MFDTFIRPHRPLSYVRAGYDFPKPGVRGGMPKILLNGVVCQKKGESSKKEGSVGNNWKAKICFAKAIVKRKILSVRCPQILWRWRFKKWKSIVNLSSRIQHVMRFTNAAESHCSLYGAWWCEPPDEAQKLNSKSSSFSVFKTWILDCFIPGEYSKISELPLQKISYVPRNFLGIPVHVPRPGL